MSTTMTPIHPGEVLLEEFLEPLGVTQHRLAVSIAVPPRRNNEIVHGKRRITADTALRRAKDIGTAAGLWVNLQSHYGLERAEGGAGEQIAAVGPLENR